MPTEVIISKAYPRAALIGNPSDGYYGRTIAFVFSNFAAQVTLQPYDRIEIVPTERDIRAYDSLEDFYTDMKQNGYYGGLRLIKAAIRRFYEFVLESELNIVSQNFKISYQSDIPHRLGLAGSSAIVTACIRALMRFYEVDIPKPVLANLVLSVEKEELGIMAGLQDRVAQAYETPVYMDFNKKHMDEQGFGYYEPFSKKLLPNIYIAYRRSLSEGSEVVHNNLKERYLKNDPMVHHAMEEWRSLTDAFYEAVKEGHKEKLPALINRNFDVRASVMSISRDNKQMIDAARAVGASSKFTGSGGAIIGTFTDKAMFDALKAKMENMDVEVLIPDIVGN